VPTETPTLTHTPTATVTPTQTPVATLTPTATPVANPGVPDIYLSTSGGGAVGGVTFRDEDILRYNATAQTWTMYIDSSDVGISSEIDGLHLLSDGSVLLSLEAPGSVPGVGNVDDSDIVRFVPTRLGNTTAGTFTLYFDGSDVGLSSDSENVDAIDLTANGKLIISTLGSFSVPGLAGEDEDLLVFTATRLGTSTAGTWALHFDGSDVALTNSTEDIWGASSNLSTGEIYVSTVGNFSVTGVSGTAVDIFSCMPTSLGNNTICTFRLIWRGAERGLGGQGIDALYLANAATTVANAALEDVTNAEENTTPELNDASVDLDDGEGTEEKPEDETAEETGEETGEVLVPQLYLPLIFR